MRWLLGKDLLILRRSRLLVALLIFYPVAIALLIGFAISASPAKPRVAVVDETPPGETITLGGTRVGLDEYTKQLFSQVDVVHVPTRAIAESKVASGEVLAAIVIPSDIVAKISSGVSQAQIEVIYNGDAVEQSFVRSTIDATLARANLALSEQIKSVAVHDLNLLLSGGHIGPLGSQELIGLRQLPGTLKGIASRQPPGKDRDTLTRIAGFANLAANNLGIAADVLTTVSQPIAVHSKLLQGKRTPLDTYAVVVAVTISLMFLCVLLAAGGVALEREEHTIARLVRGLISREGLLAEKAMLAAVCAFVVALAMLLGVSAFVSLDVSRIGLWMLALAFGALGFGALGVAIGALAREVRAASLLAFLLSLPLVFLALVPSGSVATGLYDVIRAVSFVFPYKAALQALDAAVNGAAPSLGASIAHLLGVTLLFGVLARLGLRRAE
ncbi:MAG TPA: ABC transporter permease [Solirubrobacteraceae bacterium]|jgi:ABC-type multidrug transport system permease subunit|nr:ABC transporter permease [Solirubrobacteraceae bacterium]